MTEKWPDPGHGYKIRERLGGGMWKTAYRASSLFSLSDVALLYFHDDAALEVLAGEQRNLLLSASNHEFKEYLARYDGWIKGQDKRWFIVEELLQRPLDRLAPVRDLAQFVNLARDLCRGLTCLHEQGAVHRDLKLDNFGLDYRQRAKIFDLGTVTSEGGDVRGTIFTRAPELWTSAKRKPQRRKKKPVGPRFIRSCDTWALGAALFALRQGSYPFVYQFEMERRRELNDQTIAGKISKPKAEEEKRELDQQAFRRITESGASAKLKARVHEVLRGRSEDILNSMLEFAPEKRKHARYYAVAWDEVAEELAQPVPPVRRHQEKWQRLLNQLRAVERHELVLSRGQLDRVIAELEEEKAKKENVPPLEELEDALRKIRVP